MNKWGFLNLLLGGVLAFVLLLLAAMHTNPNKRNGYWLEGMVSTPAPADFSDNTNFANGQTLQTPPDGTLAQGQEPYPYGGGMDEAVRAGKTVKNPLNPEDPEVLLRGKALFERNCMPCHGVAGRGDGLVTAAKREGGFPPPPSLLAAHAKGLPDGYIYNYISRGGILMPSYGAQIAPQERWKVVSWVRHMQKTFPENAPAANTPEFNSEAALVPSTTPGYGYDGPPPVDEIEADEAVQQAMIDNRGTRSEAEAAPAEGGAAVPAAAVALGANATPWQKALVLINKNDCFTCHNPDHKVVGPAFKDVAKRYYDKQPGIVAVLVKKVKAGGAGNWGQVPMAAHPNTSDADLTTIVQGILYLADPKGKGTSTSMAPSMKRVMELVHSGAPIHCPALGDTAINGPAYLADGEPLRAEVSRESASDMAALGAAGAGDKEMKP